MGVATKAASRMSTCTASTERATMVVHPSLGGPAHATNSAYTSTSTSLTGFTVVSSPSFSNPSVDDYRTGDGRGVDWQPADKHFGP
jgi:hypothetical protein